MTYRKVYLFLLFIIPILSKEAKKDEFISDEKLKEILVNLNLVGKEYITKKQFKEMYREILSKSDKQSSYFNFKDQMNFEKMLDKIVEGVPKEFPMADIDKYLTEERFLKGIGELLGGIDLKELAKEMEQIDKQNELKKQKEKKEKPEAADDMDSDEYVNDL